MITVFEREFKSLFRNVKAVACIVIYVIASAILFWVSLIEYLL